MPRANRHYLPGCVWHITHRCHKQEFLLKFEKDRKRWLYWLFEAKKRYGLCVLNYTVTSNHIHLLVVDTGKDIIPQSVQLIAGRTAQEFNIRKNRKGAFWEDRYHATAIETNEYLAQCMVYIDLNMVRAGVVKHPSEYNGCGYNEILNPPERYLVINRKMLLDYFSVQEENYFQQEYECRVDNELNNDALARNPFWSESIAVGSELFIAGIQRKLARRARKCSVVSVDGVTVLKEPQIPYNALFDAKKDVLSQKNSYIWSENV